MSQVEPYSVALVDAIDRHFVDWLERCVFDTARQQGAPVTNEMVASTANMAGAMHRRFLPAVRELLALDVDEQITTPMALLRGAIVGPTQVLAQYGVPAPDRDEFVAARFPDDPYGLTPSTFADIHAELAEPGLAWGAAKAFVHKERHRR